MTYLCKRKEEKPKAILVHLPPSYISFPSCILVDGLVFCIIIPVSVFIRAFV
jgi:hypothetical protein